MTGEQPRGPGDLTEEDRELIRRAHHRLRKASQELEALVAPRSMRGRWEPVVAPPEVVDNVRSELSAAWAALGRLQHELLGWPAGDGPGGPEAPARE
ncbi:MAG: hypothetical protein M3N28_07705 [Actinomycetota bacterium]|nr:hypothetical protein [Actinomycetota bacterium]